MLRRVGHRGGFLLFLAVLDGVYAWGLYKQAAPQRSNPELLLPWQAWVAAWALTAAVCTAGAFASRDRAAFTLAAALKTGWGAVSLYGWIAGIVPNGWLSSVVWWSLAATVLLISSWPEPVTFLLRDSP